MAKRQLKHTKRRSLRARHTRRTRRVRRSHPASRGGSLLSAPAASVVSRDGALMDLETALELGQAQAPLFKD